MKISEAQKKEIIKQMKFVINDKKGKLIALSFSTFLECLDKKTDEDFITLVKEIQDVIFNHQIFALNQLGHSFFYFKKFRFLQDSLLTELFTAFEMVDLLFSLRSPHIHINKNFPGAACSNKSAERSEPVINCTQSKRDLHIDEVGKSYEGFKQLLHSLFSDMQPTSFSNVVNERISEVYAQLAHMRNLACKHLPV